MSEIPIIKEFEKQRYLNDRIGDPLGDLIAAEPISPQVKLEEEGWAAQRAEDEANRARYHAENPTTIVLPAQPRAIVIAEQSPAGVQAALGNFFAVNADLAPHRAEVTQEFNKVTETAPADWTEAQCFDLAAQRVAKSKGLPLWAKPEETVPIACPAKSLAEIAREEVARLNAERARIPLPPEKAIALRGMK
jgi:hypothetical protein